MTDTRRPRFRVDADRVAASRRVRYIETNRPDDGSCTLCQLDEENPPPRENRAMSELPEDDETLAEEALIQAIENQLEADDPPATQATLNKLTLVGYEREESIHLMALALAREIRQMLQEDRPFDAASYEALLRGLPDLPD